MSKKVLLTGVTGFLGSHVCIALLNKGYHVRGTLRNMDRAESIREVIAKHTPNIENLEFRVADLTQHEIWNELTVGMDFIQHVASPIPRVLPKNEEALIVPAKQGTLNIMAAAAKNGVKRVVLTSSSGAIVYGKIKSERSGTYTEENWTDPTNYSDTTPYFRSKVLAEKAAWDFVEKNESALELVTVCPGAILGPVLEKDFGTSANIVIKMMDGSTPAIPKIGYEMVDVRDVAGLQFLAMEKKEASGQRYICSAGFMTFNDVADTLRAKYPKTKIPKLQLPSFAIKLFAMLDPTLKPILLDVGVERRLDSSKAREQLGWEPASPESAVLACAGSLVDLDML